MKTSTFISVLSAAATALAAPATIKTRDNVIRPSVTSNYNVWTGAVTYNTGAGVVHKSYKDADITTLVTFDFPASTQGKQCELIFDLDATATASGSQRVQVFSSLKPATGSTTTWPSGNLRDQQLGSLYFPAPPSTGVWEETGTTSSGKFPCPAGQTLAGEIVGRWDQVDIKWNAAVSGPKIVVT